MTLKATDLRPMTLDDFVGQEKVKEAIRILISASTTKPFPHAIFHGVAGHGKTTLANIIANELTNTQIITVLASQLTAEDFPNILGQMKQRTILFIDEIHALRQREQEQLFRVMEDGIFRVKQRHNGVVHTFETNVVEYLTIIGATTQFGSLLKPLRDRFQVQLHLKPYTMDEIIVILTRSVKRLDKIVDDASSEAVVALAERARYNPRTGNNLLQRVAEYMSYEIQETGGDSFSNQFIELKHVLYICDLYEIDHLGLTQDDRQVLATMVTMFKAEPVGLETLAQGAEVDKHTIKDSIEPYMLKLEFIERTVRGRKITDKGIQHIVKKVE